MVAKTGDYIIRGVEGEIYPCKPDIFEKTYEVTSQQSQLDDNQKIVLEWLKSNRNSLKVGQITENIGNAFVSFGKNLQRNMEDKK